MKSKIKIEIDSEFNEIIYNALKYEEAPRANIKCYMHNNKLIFEIETNSISNLRAACNSFIKWINMIIEISKDIQKDIQKF